MDILASQCRKIANNDGLPICPSSPYSELWIYAMYQKAQDNFIDPGLLSSLKRKIISEEPGAVDGRQL